MLSAVRYVYALRRSMEKHVASEHRQLRARDTTDGALISPFIFPNDTEISRIMWMVPLHVRVHERALRPCGSTRSAQVMPPGSHALTFLHCSHESCRVGVRVSEDGSVDVRASEQGYLLSAKGW